MLSWYACTRARVWKSVSCLIVPAQLTHPPSGGRGASAAARPQLQPPPPCSPSAIRPPTLRHQEEIYCGTVNPRVATPLGGGVALRRTCAIPAKLSVWPCQWRLTGLGLHGQIAAQV